MKSIAETLQDLREAGMLFVVASGNLGNDLDARPSYPASAGKDSDNVIVVGSSGPTDQVSSFSNKGKNTVHLLSPGEAILSTTYNSWYGPMDGTSMATPLVAGAAALLHSAALSHGVQLSYTDIKRLLLSTVDTSPPGDTADATLTGGRLNIGASMAALALLMQERGMPELSGGWLEGSAAEELQQKLLQNPWGQELLAEFGPQQAQQADRQLDGGSPQEGSEAVQEEDAEGSTADAAAKEEEEGAAGAVIEEGTAGDSAAEGAEAQAVRVQAQGQEAGIQLQASSTAAPAAEAAAPQPEAAAPLARGLRRGKRWVQPPVQ